MGDKPMAEQLKRDLERADLRVTTIDQVPPGEAIAAAVIDAIEAADAILIFLSPRSAASQWVQAEASFALARALRDPSVRVIPVIVEQPVEIPRVLDGIGWIDITDPDSYDRELRRLANELLSPRHFGDPRKTVERASEAIALREALLEHERLAYQLEAWRLRQHRLLRTRRVVLLALLLTATTVAIASAAAWDSSSESTTSLLAVALGLIASIAGYLLGARTREVKNSSPDDEFTRPTTHG